jgi:hypothetical protein
MSVTTKGVGLNQITGSFEEYVPPNVIVNPPPPPGFDVSYGPIVQLEDGDSLVPVPGVYQLVSGVFVSQGVSTYQVVTITPQAR